MFGNQDELTKPLPNKMIINIVGNNYLNEALISSCLDITEGDYAEKFRFINFSNIDEMVASTKVKKEKADDNQIYGLLNLNWIKKISTLRPGTIILVYDIKNKSETVSWREFENSIFIDIQKCKKLEKNDHANIVVIIIANSSSFNLDHVNDEKDKIYSIRKSLDVKNLFYINGLESLKSWAKKLTFHLINITVNYYRQIKKKLKLKMIDSKDFKEFVIKSNIKLGILSQMKNKKKNLKYFESAYAHLIDLIERLKNYAYGTDIKMNYFEIKAVADWLYFKLLQIRLNDIMSDNNKNYVNIINSFNIHIQFFSKIDLFIGNNFDDYNNTRNSSINIATISSGRNSLEINRKSSIEGSSNINKGAYDNFLIIEYFWKIIRLEGFAKILEENMKFFKEDFIYRNSLNFPGYYNMVTKAFF